MVDLQILEAKGCSSEKLKSFFTGTGENAKRDKLTRLLRSRIDEGQQTNIGTYRIYQALDTAWDIPLKQITPTMLQSLIDSNMTVDAMLDTLKTWGVDPNEVMSEYPDPKNPTKTLKRVNIPAFSRIFVPLVRAYVTIRRAGFMNERKLVPFIKFEPAISDETNRMRCEVITSRVEEMSQNYGYWDVEDQRCWRMLHYGICLAFPVEEWHREEQLVEQDSPYEGETEGKYKRVVMKEGIRYHMPHPTRMFYDAAWPTQTLNTDSGASYAGYWRIMRYGEIVNKKKFWNLDVIKVGNSSEFVNVNKAFFDNVYPCTMTFPTNASAGGDYDQERKISDALYVSTDEDKGLILTELFMKLIPEDYGLGDYEFPVWFRFVVANNTTVLYCTPLPYTNPVLYDGYDPVSGRSMNPSMSLEIMPFQDHFANLLSQYLLSVKQNLVNMTLIDTDSVDEEEIGFLEKWSQKLWSGLNIIRFSSRKMFKSQQNPQVAFPQKFPQVDTNSIAVAMKTVLEVLERVLVMSSQELGQAATHEQTREEVRNIASNVSTRAQFTSSALDRSRQAWKRQIYEGLMAYGKEEGYAQVPADPKITPELLSKLGFTWEGDFDKEKKKITVRFNKTAIRIESFSANRDGDDRINDLQNAQAMGAFMQQLLANQMTAQAIGPDQALAMANIIGRSAGWPRDFKLNNRGQDQTPEEQGQEIMQQVQQMIQQSDQQMEQEIKGVVTEIVKVNDQQSQQIDQVFQILSSLGAQVPPEAQQSPQEAPMPQEMPPPQQMPQQMQALPAEAMAAPMQGAPPMSMSGM